LDGVVVNTPRFHYLAWSEALRTVGVTVSEAEVYALEGSKDIEIAIAINESRNLDFSPGDLESISRLKQARLLQILKPEPMLGIKAFIKQLTSDEIPVALVSGTSRDAVKATLGQVGLGDAFDVVVTGDDVIQGKPSAEPYAQAVRSLGILPNSCLAVENATAGVHSARAAGFFCVAITSTLPSETLYEASVIFDDIPAVAAWFYGRGRKSSRC
jgi:HAD superfamily hydrolase (TIGR01509 family)